MFQDNIRLSLSLSLSLRWSLLLTIVFYRQAAGAKPNSFSPLVLFLSIHVGFRIIFVLLTATFHVAGPFQPGRSWQGFCATPTFAAAILWAVVIPTVLASMQTLLRSTDVARIRIKDSLKMVVLRNGQKVLNSHLMCAAHRESGMDALPFLSPEFSPCSR